MDIIKMMETHPKTGEVIRQGIRTFVKELQMQMMDEVDATPEDLPDVADEEINDFIQATMNNPDSTGMLIEIFDAHKVYVQSLYDSNDKWYWEVNGNSDVKSWEIDETPLNSRKEGYEKAFPTAFKILEEQLTKKE